MVDFDATNGRNIFLAGVRAIASVLSKTYDCSPYIKLCVSVYAQDWMSHDAFVYTGDHRWLNKFPMAFQTSDFQNQCENDCTRINCVSQEKI